MWAPYIDHEVVAALLTPPRPKLTGPPAVYLQSNPMDRSGRMLYVKELMKRVKVASFGWVMNNQGDIHLGGDRAAKLALIGQYRFTLAFENAIERDYVTEKLYDALIAGSVPVYLGAPNVREFAPAPQCYIDAAHFAGPVELAAYLNQLVEDERAYGEYLAWKTTGLSAGFRALAAEVARPALERLCTYLRATIDPRRRPGGRPSYPIRSAWYRRLARRLLPPSVVRRRDRSEVPGALGTGGGGRR